MTHSNINQEATWQQLLKMYFGVGLGAAESAAWFTELRLTVKGWRHNSLIESSLLDSQEAGSIKVELCDVLRYINGMETTPRKNRGKASGESKGKFNVADLQLWVWIYRKNREKDAVLGIEMAYVNACIALVQCFIDKGQELTAALVAGGHPDTGFDHEAGGDGYADFDRLFSEIGNRQATGNEVAKIQEFCDGIGFNPQRVIDEIIKESTRGGLGVGKAVQDITEELEGWRYDS